MIEALIGLFSTDMMENDQNSIFAGLGWSRSKCAGLVSNDSALEQAVSGCFKNESLDPLRQYG